MDIYLLPSSQIKLTVSKQVFSFGVSVTFPLQKKIFLIEKSGIKFFYGELKNETVHNILIACNKEL